MPRVSYVVTIYNKAPYLPYLIEGLANQEGEFEREHIFVNDGSTDDSLAVLRGLAAAWPGVKIIDQPNGGPSLAMNAGLRAASGDFIKPVDGDDMLVSDATGTLLQAIDATGCGVAYGEGGEYRLDEGLVRAREKANRASPDRDPVVDGNTLGTSLRRAQTTPSAWLARADLVRAVGGCDPGVFIQDYSIELRLAHAARFARVPRWVYLAPAAAPGRMSENGAQTLHDLNLALARFVEAGGDLPWHARRLALRRASGRAWHFARREAGKGYFSADFRRHLSALLGLSRGPAAIEATCAVFRETGPIRLMPASLEGVRGQEGIQWSASSN
jgi:glycosyltransferase involved in cell wall biosynthesis